MAKNEASSNRPILLHSRIQTQHKAYVLVRLRKEKKCVRPVIHAYGTDPEEICKAAIEAFERVRNKLIQKGYSVVPLQSSHMEETT